MLAPAFAGVEGARDDLLVISRTYSDDENRRDVLCLRVVSDFFPEGPADAHLTRAGLKLVLMLDDLHLKLVHLQQASLVGLAASTVVGIVIFA